jgi:hypothetical protein
MDYNIRAARAGFKGVWVLDSYVYRSPFTPRRQLEEAARFQASAMQAAMMPSSGAMTFPGTSFGLSS